LSQMHTTDSGWLCLQPGDCGLWAWNRDNVYALIWSVRNLPDKWSHKILEFKKGNTKAFDGVYLMLQNKLPPLISGLNLNMGEQPIYVVTALYHDAEKAQPDKSLYKIAKMLCDHMEGLEFRPGLLTKKKHRPLHSITNNGQNRDAEVRNANYKCNRLEEDSPVFLILDDFVTRGATFTAIRIAIESANGNTCKILPVALGKYVTQRDIEPNNDNDERLGDIKQFWK